MTAPADEDEDLSARYPEPGYCVPDHMWNWSLCRDGDGKTLLLVADDGRTLAKIVHHGADAEQTHIARVLVAAPFMIGALRQVRDEAAAEPRMPPRLGIVWDALSRCARPRVPPKPKLRLVE